jgi:ectoine hydroxylase-related dioxygenase (phytanoyl-CoA dioxygenase family)
LNCVESPSATEEYMRDGYYVARDILSLKKISFLRRQMATVLAQQLRFLGEDIEPSGDQHALFHIMKRLFDSDRNRYLASLRLISKLCSLQTLMSDPVIVRFVTALGIELPVMQSRPVFHVMSHQLAFENGYFGFGVHQDWPALQSSLDMVTAWIPFVDVTRDLFALEVIPGSHVHGLLPGKAGDHILEIDPAQYHSADFFAVEARQGDVVFMSGFTLHRSGQQGNPDSVRLAASCRYENAMEKNFVAHAYPFSQHTVVNRELLFEDFPTAQQVADARNKR